MTPRGLKHTLPALCLFGLASCISPQNPVPQQQEGTRTRARVGQATDRAHQWVSARITEAASWLDSFFGSERHEEEVNTTQLRIRTDAIFEEGGETDLEVKAQLRLALPGVEDRLHLLVASNADDDLGIDTDPLDDTQRVLVDSEKDDNSVGAELFLLDDLQRNAKLEAGLRFRDSEPTPRLGARYRRTFDAEPWLIRVTERVGWESAPGFDSRTSLDLDRVVSPSLFFRATSGVAWYEERHGVFLRQAFRLAQRVSERGVVAYSWVNDFGTDATDEFDLVRLRVGYRHRIREWWAFVEIAPEVRFPGDQDFEPEAALLLRLALYFGAEDG